MYTRHNRLPIVVFCVFACLVLAVSGSRAADATIGLYEDEFGLSCSFNNAPGLVTAYVVVKPGTGGTRGVQFSAPTPSCFDATFITETKPALVFGTGSSQTGIWLAHNECQTVPFTVLEILYVSNGGTTPCCEYPIVADPSTGTLDAFDCAFATAPIATNVARFNADASCACAAPIPTTPTPPDQSVDRPRGQTLSWQVTGDAQNVTYNVYLGTSDVPTLVASNHPAQTYDPGGLDPLTTYRWKIVTKVDETEVPGPIWTFTTADEGPYAPSNPSPENSDDNVSVGPTLSWTASHAQDLPMTFDVYLAVDGIESLLATGVTVPWYNTGLLRDQTWYFWRVVARDQTGLSTSSPVWRFRTVWTLWDENSPPTRPSNPSPPNNGTATASSPAFSWFSADPEHRPLTFTILLSASPSIFPGIIAIGNSSLPQYNFGPLSGQYYWQVHSSDGVSTNVGPVWTFLASGGPLPVSFTRFDAKPSGNAIDVHWEIASDEAMSGFTLYRRGGTSSLKTIVAEGEPLGTTGSHHDAAVEAGTTYHYELLVRAADGDEFRSPVATASMAALELVLHPNVPNPFNPQTSLRYDLPETARVTLQIVDVSGRVVRTLVDKEQTAGSWEVIWTGQDDAGTAVASGVYFSVLDAGKQRLTRKLVLLK